MSFCRPGHRVKVDTLKNLALKCLIENLQRVESLGTCLPEDVLDPIFQHCTPELLMKFEADLKRHHKSFDTSIYWKNFCRSLGVDTQEDPQAYGCGTWKSVYKFKKAQNEEKKRKFSEKAREMYKSEEKAKQAKSIKVIEAPKKFLNQGKTTSSIPVMKKSASSSGRSTQQVPKPPPKAKLMRKTLNDMKKKNSVYGKKN